MLVKICKSDHRIPHSGIEFKLFRRNRCFVRQRKWQPANDIPVDIQLEGESKSKKRPTLPSKRVVIVTDTSITCVYFSDKSRRKHYFGYLHKWVISWEIFPVLIGSTKKKVMTLFYWFLVRSAHYRNRQLFPGVIEKSWNFKQATASKKYFDANAVTPWSSQEIRDQNKAQKGMITYLVGVWNETTLNGTPSICASLPLLSKPSLNFLGEFID